MMGKAPSAPYADQQVELRWANKLEIAPIGFKTFSLYSK